MFQDYDFKRFDYILVIIIILLAIAGVVAIGSATRINSIEGTDAMRNKQIVGFITGGILMLFFAMFDYKWIGKLTPAVFLMNVGLLAAVLVAGVVVNGAKRWIDIGPFRLQPSEFAKIFTVLVLAKYFDVLRKHINNPLTILGGLGITGISVGLIYLQPDLSTSLIMFVIYAFILFAAGISFWYIAAAAAVVVPGGIWFYNYIQQPDLTLLKSILSDYQVNRIVAAFNPDEVDADAIRQTQNSMQAIGSGKFFGKGLYMGKVNQYDYLPEPQTDFIFSIIGEEFGFFGCVVVLLLLFILILRLLWVAKDAKDMYAKLIITGFVAILTYQTFVNVGVATGILPNTGVPLPFISYGVSSLWNNLIGIGIILNISMQRRKVGFVPPISGVNSPDSKRRRRRGTTT